MIDASVGSVERGDGAAVERAAERLKESSERSAAQLSAVSDWAPGETLKALLAAHSINQGQTAFYLDQVERLDAEAVSSMRDAADRMRELGARIDAEFERLEREHELRCS